MDLKEYKKKIANLSVNEQKLRDLYLRDMALGKVQGPPTGYASIDKPWLKYYSEEAILKDLPEATCYEYLVDCNKDNMNAVALSYMGKKITFKEFFDNVERVSKSLSAMGLKEKDIVSISLPNIPEAAYLFYACSKLGIIANMIDPRTSNDGFSKYIREVDSKYVFIIDSYYEKVKKLSSDGIVDKVIAVSPAESLPFGLNYAYRLKSFFDGVKDANKKVAFSDKIINWNKFLEEGKNILFVDSVHYEKNRPLVIEHTGGTTGVPKGVLLSNENINAVVMQSIMTGIDMKREHNWLDIMPTFIAYGVGMGLHLPLTIGMETILVPQFDADRFDDLLVKYKPVHMVGVPSYWGTIINSKKLAKKDLSYIIAPTVGGDSMDITLEKNANKFLEDHGSTSKITKGYGMTEVCGGVSGTVDDNNQIGSVGIPFVKSNIGIFNPETGEELPFNTEGEVCITGPNIMLGYYNNELATNDILKVHDDGTTWIHSGDIGYMDENGALFIIDRLKRMIIRYDGFKIFPSQIEKVISSHCDVEMCKVVGVDDICHSQGKLPKAHIVLKENTLDEDVVLSNIKMLCESKLPEYMLPVEYKIREDLPLTPVGKVDYLALEKEDKGINRVKVKK